MNPWPFIAAAYVVAAGAAVTLALLSLRGMRRAERQAAEATGRRR